MKKIFPFILFILVIIVGCSSNSTANSIDTPLYNGNPLVIGIIGDSPEVREDNVEFRNITFKQLEENNNLSSELDAIMIMKEHLAEAAESKYAKVYKNPSIPYFFIESSTKSNYATGYFQSGEDESKDWSYGLYNSKVNETNIKDVYSRIFTTIASVEI